MLEHELSGMEPRIFDVHDGWKEADTVENVPHDMSGSEFYSDILVPLRKYLTDHPEYTGVFAGLGEEATSSSNSRSTPRSSAAPGCSTTREEFLSDAWACPDELWIEIERKIIDALGRAAAVRITDPEGTHLEFPVSAEEAFRWKSTAWRPGHLFLDILQSTSQENAIIPVSAEVPPVFRDINGVMAATSNHFGYLPRIELFFEHGRLVDVKGGGRYGEIIRELKEKYKHVHWPGYPGDGFFWYADCALCTVVKAFRRTSDMFHSYWRLPNVTERNRAGVFHMGMGSRRHGDEYLKYAKENKIPTGHIHIHNYFATFEIKVQGTDYWYKIIDKGRPSALDEPDIRALAVKYGDPDKLLSFDWVPPLPGVNCEGDYMRDYAPDPAAYLENRMKNGEVI